MKKTLSFFLAVIIAACTLFAMAVTVSAESLYIRKIVSVVYDDSGSMAGEKWGYANYAMQTFCGMLNSEDQLYITYMSDVGGGSQYVDVSEEIKLSTGEIQNSVDSIRNHTKSGDTPYTAVEAAYKKLTSVKDSNPNTQYWLVVITDGDFNETTGMSSDAKKRDLNQKLNEYTKDKMPNGTDLQITFLGIGDITVPDEDVDRGIYTYSANDADNIVDAMSSMADRISGRTRLDGSDIKQKDGKTIEVSSSIPLLNIAILAQESDAKITSAFVNNESEIPVSREASLYYNNIFVNMKGGAFLVGDSQNVIGSGTYEITFDKDVDAEDIVILFEPALEMRMTITVNGREITDYKELDNLAEGDKISVSCKVYEMGTNNEISPDLLPPGTKFEISISEDGKVVKKETGEEMQLSDYVLHNLETEIRAAVMIEGFNPIEYTEKFTPTEERVVYSLSAEFGGDKKSIKLDDLSSNTDVTVVFTVYADGEPLTDANAVKALNPQITVSPDGNSGSVTYSNDGKIIFTPNTASVPSGVDSFDVDVTCSIDGADPVTETYTILVAEYEVFPVDAGEKVKKTGFFGNTVGVSFYITKDGVKLGKSEVDKNITVKLNDEHSKLQLRVNVDDDGTIHVTPYSDEEHVLNFLSWWGNWAYYFSLSGKDAVVTLNHPFGTADAVIDVVGEGVLYQILNVYLPLLLEILFITAVISYIVRYFTKARFASNGVLYVGSITRSGRLEGTHMLELVEVHLNQYNKFKNLWNPFKELTVSANGVNITAAPGNKIICNEPFPWYSDGIRPKSRTITISSPKDVVNYCQEHNDLLIHEIKTIRAMDEQNRYISQDDSVYYFVRADTLMIQVGMRQTEVIDSAIAFCYSTIQN